MRKMFLCTLAFFGFLNFSVAQHHIPNSEWLLVKTFEQNRVVELFRLKAQEAKAFDIPAFIKENEDLDRIIINGQFRTQFSTTIIKFDSKDQNKEAGQICKDVDAELIPFLGVWGSGRRDLTGVDVNSIVPSTSAEEAGMTGKEIITEYNDHLISNFPELKEQVLSSEIGERVVLNIQKGDAEYEKLVILGSRGLTNINYRFCHEKQEDIIEKTLTIKEPVSFSTYPNPTNAISRVHFKSGSKEDIIFSVSDIQGNVVHKKTYNNMEGELNIEYNLDQHVNGTYIISIQQGKEIYTSTVQLIKD